MLNCGSIFDITRFSFAIMDNTESIQPRKWEIELFFQFPPVRSPITMDVFETLQREERSSQPLRRLADSIIRGISLDIIEKIVEAEGLQCNLNDPISKGLRLVHYAAYQNDADTLHFLLKFGADPNVMDDMGFTPLHLCSQKGFTDLIIMLLSHGARIRFTEVHPQDKSYGNPPRATAADEPLRLAIRHHEYAAARLLLANGANPSARYFLGYEINLVDTTDLKSLELLLRYGADPNARDIQGITPLMKACRNPQALEAVHLLISYGSDVKAVTNEEQRTPLHYAVLAENLETVKMLVRNGAEVSFPLELTRPPPLFLAVLRGNVGIIEFLLDSGADVNAVSTVVGSALHLALTEEVVNQLEVVRFLLIRGANPNAITVSADGRPVLKPPIGEYLQYCEHPNLEMIRLLLRYGARIVFKGQRDHHLGIVKVVHRIHLGLNPEVMNMLVDACESFDVRFIERSRQLSDEHKELMLKKASQPFSLMQIARIQLRKTFDWGPIVFHGVQCLGIPEMLQRYILFEE